MISLGINLLIFVFCFIRVIQLIKVKPPEDVPSIICAGVVMYIIYTIGQVGITLIITNL